MKARLFYNYKESGDILFIRYSDKDINKTVSYDEHVIGLFKDDELVEINIINFSKIAKIFYEGEIECPSVEFLELVNHILINAGAKPLEGE